MAYTHLKTAHVIHEKFELVEFIRFDVGRIIWGVC